MADETEDPDYDADLDAATTPFKGANPFDTRATGKVSVDTKPVGSTAVTNARKAPMGGPRSADARLRKPDAVAAAQAATDKPKYRGSFVGQQADAGKQGAYKNVSWMGADNQRRYGKVHGMQANQPWVWDGKDWVKSSAFDMKFKGKKGPTEATARPIWDVLAESVLDEAPSDKGLRKLGIDPNKVTDDRALIDAVRTFVTHMQFGAQSLSDIARRLGGDRSAAVVKACEAIIKCGTELRSASVPPPGPPLQTGPKWVHKKGATPNDDWYEPEDWDEKNPGRGYRSGD